MFPHLGCRPASAAAPLTFVVLSVVKPFEADSGGRMPTLQSVEPGEQRLHTCHQDRSLGPRLTLESVAEVLAAHVGLPPCVGCSLLLDDSLCSIQRTGVRPVYQCASACISSEDRLTVCFFLPGDGRVSRDRVDLGCTAMGEEIPRPSVVSHRQELPLPRLRGAVCRIAGCGSRKPATVSTP